MASTNNSLNSDQAEILRAMEWNFGTHLPLLKDSYNGNGMKIENGVITDIRLQTIVPHLKARTILGKSLNPDMIKNILNLTTRLKSLRTLSLIDLRLKTLPESFGTLEDLKELYLRDPSFRKLPETFGDLKSQIPPNPNAYR